MQLIYYDFCLFLCLFQPKYKLHKDLDFIFLST